jgi:hypothetical protein
MASNRRRRPALVLATDAMGRRAMRASPRSTPLRQFGIGPVPCCE